MIQLFLDLFRIETVNLSGISDDRLALIKFFFSNISEIPLFGLGMGNQTLIWETASTFTSYTSSLTGFGIHNTFIQIYIELGLVGFLTFFLFLLYLIYICLIKKKYQMLIALIILIISSLFESNIFYITSPNSILFWYVACKIIVFRKENNEDPILAKYN